MTRSQAIKKLRKEGYAATVGRLRQAIENGHVPPPEKGARGRYDYQLKHLRQPIWKSWVLGHVMEHRVTILPKLPQ